MEGTVDEDNDTVTAKLTHLSTYAVLAYIRPADFQVAPNFSLVPLEIDLGGSVSIDVLVTNTGDLTGSYEVSLKLNDAVIQTQEVTLVGGDSETVSFSVNPDAAGKYQAVIGDSLSLARFTVTEPEAPAPAPAPAPTPVSLPTSPPETTPTEVEAPLPVAEETSSARPEINSLSATPVYDTATGKLISARIDYRINGAEEPTPEAELTLKVFLDGETLEEIPLLSLDQLQPGENTGSLSYIPSQGWHDGTYDFQAELHEGDEITQSTQPEKFILIQDSTAAVVSWQTLGVIIGIMVVLTALVLALVLYRKRDMLRGYIEDDK
jgi:hypothetical protein